MSFDIFPLNVHTAATPAEYLICYCIILIFWEHLFMFVRISIFGGISTQIDSGWILIFQQLVSSKAK